MAFDPRDVFLGRGYTPTPKDVVLGTNGPSGVSSLTAFPSVSVSAWVIGAIAIVTGAASVTPSPAQGQWVTNNPSTVQGALTAAPAVATSQWVGVSPNVLEGPDQASPAVAVSSWSIPTVAAQSGPLSVTAPVATSQWVGLSPNVLEGPDQASPAVALSSWVVLDPATSVGTAGPQTATPDVAISTWVVPTPFAGEIVTNIVTPGRYYPWVRSKAGFPQSVYPSAAISRWHTLSPDTELGDVSRTLDPATSDWVVNAVETETAPDPDEEMLIALMAEL